MKGTKQNSCVGTKPAWLGRTGIRRECEFLKATSAAKAIAPETDRGTRCSMPANSIFAFQFERTVGVHPLFTCLFQCPVHVLFRGLFRRPGGPRLRLRLRLRLRVGVGVGATAGPPHPPLWQRSAELEGRGGGGCSPWDGRSIEDLHDPK